MTTITKNKIKKFHSFLEQEIIKRDNYFCKKSEEWQESDAGEDYDIETGMLKELFDNVSDSITDFGILLIDEQ